MSHRTNRGAHHCRLTTHHQRFHKADSVSLGLGNELADVCERSIFDLDNLIDEIEDFGTDPLTLGCSS